MYRLRVFFQAILAIVQGFCICDLSTAITQLFLKISIIRIRVILVVQNRYRDLKTLSLKLEVIFDVDLFLRQRLENWFSNIILLLDMFQRLKRHIIQLLAVLLYR